jgi:hypothetical protein
MTRSTDTTLRAARRLAGRDWVSCPASPNEVAKRARLTRELDALLAAPLVARDTRKRPHR